MWKHTEPLMWAAIAAFQGGAAASRAVQAANPFASSRRTGIPITRDNIRALKILIPKRKDGP